MTPNAIDIELPIARTTNNLSKFGIKVIEAVSTDPLSNTFLSVLNKIPNC